MSGAIRSMAGPGFVAIRLSAENAEPTRRALEQVGETGERALRRIGSASTAAQPALQGLASVSDTALRAFGSLGARLGGLGISLGGAERLLGGVTRGASGAAAAIATLAAATATAGITIARAGDQATTSLARLQAATGSIASATTAYDGLYRLSQQTGIAVAESAGAFARFAIAARQVGATNEQILALVRTVQQAGILAGASTHDTSSAVLQLGQALASGTLQGDELRAILEAMPSLAEALARELGVGVGELRRMGSEGLLTADRVLPALVRAGERINAAFERLPPSMGRAFAILGEAMTRFAADLDRALGLSRAIATAAQTAAAAVDRSRVAVGLGTPEETARAGAADATRRLEDAIRQAAQAERLIAALEALPRRTAPETASLETLRRQVAPLRADRQRAAAELERHQAELAEIERDGLVARLGEEEAAARQQATLQQRRDAERLAELRQALDRERGVREQHAARVGQIEELQARGSVEAAEASRLRAAADRERDEALQRLGRTAEETARRQAGAEQRAQQQEREAAAALERQQREAERTTDDIVRYGASAFADMFEANGRGWSGMLQSFEATFRRTFARMAAEAVIRPIVQPIVSGILGTPGSDGTFAGGLAQLLGLSGIGSQLSGALGLGSLGSGITGLLGAPLLGQAALASATTTALGGMGGVLGPATAAQLGLGGVTLGSALGALGAGFGAGSLLNSLAGGRPTGGMIGSGVGSAAGALIGSIIPGIGTLLGGLIGGAGGGLFGGLFGPGPSNREGTASFDLATGQTTIGGQVGRKFSQENRDAAAAAVQQARDLVAGITTAIGGSLTRGRFTIGVGDRDGLRADIDGTWLGRYPRNEAGFEQAIGDVVRGLLPGITGGMAAELRTAIGVSGATAPREILDIATWIGGVYRGLTEIREPIDAYAEQLRALNKTYDDAVARARSLGLSEQALQDGRARALAELDRQRREAAAPQLTGLVSSLADTTRRLRAANDNPLTPTTRLDLASRQFDADLSGALGGDARALGRIQSSADTLLGLSRDVYGSGQGFAATFDRVLAGIGSIAEMGDERLTASVLAAETRSQTETLVEALARLQAEVAALRREVQQGSANPLLARSA